MDDDKPADGAANTVSNTPTEQTNDNNDEMVLMGSGTGGEDEQKGKNHGEQNIVAQHLGIATR